MSRVKYAVLKNWLRTILAWYTYNEQKNESLLGTLQQNRVD